jgi:hypothetical protein
MNILEEVRKRFSSSAILRIRKALRVFNHLAMIFGTDKWGCRWYTQQHYDRYFGPVRSKKLDVLEIGVGDTRPKADVLAFTLGSDEELWMKVMTWKPVGWIGLVSYTGYLIRTGVLALVTPSSSLIANRALAFAVVMAYASLSWLLLEKPILKLRSLLWLGTRRSKLQSTVQTELEKA